MSRGKVCTLYFSPEELVPYRITKVLMYFYLNGLFHKAAVLIYL